MNEYETLTEALDAYDEALDSLGPLKIGYLEFNASDILAKMDPIAYRCGFADWFEGDEYPEGDDIRLS